MASDPTLSPASVCGLADPTIALLLSAEALGELLGCSARHVRRVSEGGAFPRPLKLGRLVRWRRSDVDKWIERGCPSCRGGAR